MSFTYSQVVSESVLIENSINISQLSVEIDSEPAPWCQVEGAFAQDAWEEPRLVFAFSNCQNLLGSELELGIVPFDDSLATDIESLMTLINDNLQTVDVSGGGFELSLTFSQIHQILGAASTIEDWITADFHIAMRNSGGKSVKFLTIENNSELAHGSDDGTDADGTDGTGSGDGGSDGSGSDDGETDGDGADGSGGTGSDDGGTDGADDDNCEDNDGHTIIGNLTQGFDFIGNWNSVNIAGHYNGNVTSISTGFENKAFANWTHSVASPTSAELFLSWAPAGNRARAARVEIFDGANLIGNVTLNQTEPPGDLQVEGVGFRSLGHFNFNSGAIKVVINGKGEGFVMADALLIDECAGTP